MARSWIRKLAGDRFVWFLILGAGLFALHAWLDNPASNIRVSSSDMTMLASRWQAQTGAAPTPDELNSLVEYHVREEILAREARRLGLDADDAILRRRLVQKMELLIRDRYDPPPPSDGDLRAYFADHQSDFAATKRVGFRHVFLGAADEVSPESLAQIQSRLANAQSPNAWRSVGKPFMLARQFGPLNDLELTELFGRDFSDVLLATEEPDGWIGPITSAYGLHLVQVLSVTPPQTPSFEDVREDVAAAYRDAQIAAHEADAWRDIRARYHVTIQTPDQ